VQFEEASKNDCHHDHENLLSEYFVLILNFVSELLKVVALLIMTENLISLLLFFYDLKVAFKK
jgi:hypothetical protein